MDDDDYDDDHNDGREAGHVLYAEQKIDDKRTRRS